VAERRTRASAPNAPGIRIPEVIRYGVQTREYMIDVYRRHFEQQLKEAQDALSVSDDEIRVHVYQGVHTRRFMREVTE
jgi:hypothetical protein